MSTKSLTPQGLIDLPDGQILLITPQGTFLIKPRPFGPCSPRPGPDDCIYRDDYDHDYVLLAYIRAPGGKGPDVIVQKLRPHGTPMDRLYFGKATIENGPLRRPPNVQDLGRYTGPPAEDPYEGAKLVVDLMPIDFLMIPGRIPPKYWTT